MDLLGSYVFRILCCALLCGICLSLFPDTAVKGSIRFLGGLLLLLSLLRPGEKVTLPDYDDMLWNWRQQAQTASAEGQTRAKETRREIIKEALEAYILDKGKAMGCDLSVEVTLDETDCPCAVRFTGTVSPGQRSRLETILREELGIAKEDQQWNGQGTLP